VTVPFLGGRDFRDRAHAGRVLASQLGQYAGRGDVIVLGLPRGGVPVAYEVAAALGAPLDVLLVRKLGVPGHTELAMGAIGPGGVRVVNPSVVGSLGIPDEVVDEVARQEQAELARRQQLYRGDREPPSVAAKVAIVVDDGLATGATMRAAVSALRAYGPARVVVAVPVGARRTCRELEEVADEVVCARMPATFQAVGQWYADFVPTSDAEIIRLLRAPRSGGEPESRADPESGGDDGP
jgi:predicted phosphoribosyltransferase